MTSPDGTIFFLPGLGFGAAAAAPLAEALGERFRVVGIDLPGHAEAPDAANGSVSALADAALRAIEAEADGGPFLLAAHSMGGKVAALVITRVLGGHARVFGLAGAVLLAPSPPTPEPMDEAKRAEMLAWADDGAISESDARTFVSQNVATGLTGQSEEEAVAQVRQMSPLAWQRWLTEGSREDVSGAVGSIHVPVTVLAGADDDDLGSAAQPRLLESVYPRARFVALPKTGHLLPYERPAEVAAEIVRLWESTVDISPQVAPEWGRLIASDRTAVEQRGLLAQRAIADDRDYAPRALSTHQLALLRALADRLVPQPDPRRIDLAARIDADLAAGRGDGWRPSGLPDDASASRLALDAIGALWPASPAEQDSLIARIIAGDELAGDPWGDGLLQHWFEDLRTDLVRTWLAHPASLARVGYDGFATSAAGDPGAAPEAAGFTNLGAGIRDPWEPTELGTVVPEQSHERTGDQAGMETPA